MYLKIRLFALAIVVVSAAMIYLNWRDLWQDGSYSLKIATFAPVGVIGGLFLLGFPTKFGKPVTVMEKIVVLTVFVIGLAAGLANWYLMDPGYFGR